MALKKRTVVSPAAGAVSLPSLMADLPGTRRLEEVIEALPGWQKKLVLSHDTDA